MFSALFKMRVLISEQRSFRLEDFFFLILFTRRQCEENKLIFRPAHFDSSCWIVG